MALLQVINTRTTDYEDKGQLLNVAGLTLTNAATAANEPLRKGEFDAAIASLSFDNVVESTETSLAEYVTANGTGLAEGTLLYLPNAPERENRFVRRDVAESDAGTVDDFLNINAASNFMLTDLTDVYSGADGISIDDVNGLIGITDASITLAKLASDVTDAIDGKAITKEYAISFGAPDGSGISTATIDTSTDFGTKTVSVRILKDLGDGYFEHISTSTLEVSSNATSIRLRTDSGSITSATLVAEVTGVPAV